MTAAETKEPQVDWPTAPIGGYTLDENSTIPDLVAYFFGWGVGLGGLAVFVALIIAGVQFITSTADPAKVNDAKNRIKSSVIGLALLLSSWAIFNLINPNLNTLQDISKLQSDISKYGIATGITCNNTSDCCKIPDCNPITDCSDPSSPNCCYDFNCKIENFACCPFNDTGCIQGRSSSLNLGSTASDNPCKTDSDCESGYCKCDRSIIPWKQICKPNPTVCINILGEPDLGCDYVGFFTSVDFQGTNEYIKVDFADSGWIDVTSKTSITNIRSYQAYKVARNPKNKNEYYDDNGNITTNIDMAKKIPCGQTGCGCELKICNDNNPTGSSCVNIVDYGLAFNTNVDDSDKEWVKIQDESKSFINEAKKVPGDIWNWLKSKL